MSSSATVVLQDWLPGTTNYRIRSIIMMSVWVVYTIYVLATIVMFVVKARDKRSGLDKRNVMLVFIQAFGCYMVGVDGLVTAAYNDWSCFGKLWLFNIGFVLSLTALTARAFHLMVISNMHRLNIQLASRSLAAAPFAGSSLILPSNFEKSTDDDLGGGEQSSACRLRPKQLQQPESRLRLSKQLQKYKRLLPFVTERMLVIYIGAALVLAIILTLIINIVDKQFTLRPMNIVCTYYWGFIPANVLVLLHLAIVYPILLWRIWRAKDAYGIRNDLIICETVGVICMTITIVWVNSLQLVQQKWPGMSFIWIYAAFIHTSSVLLPLLRAIQHTKQATAEKNSSMLLLSHASSAQTMVPSTRRINFNRTMDDPAEYQRFRLFAASCFCSELTAFVDEYQLLKARTLSHFGLLQTNGAGFTIPRHQNSPPSTPSTLAATDSDGIDDDSEQRHRRLRMSRCMVDNALTQSMEFMSSALTTSITVSILETVVAAFPDQNSGSGMEQFPADMFDKLDMIRREFVDPRSFTSVNASPLTVKRFMERMESKDLSLTLLDEFKSEVLFMLYTDVYMRYVKKE